MFKMGTEAWIIIARSALVFVATFVGLRIMGKRELGQMTVFDLVVSAHLRKEGLDRDEVEMAIREHGLDSVSSVKLAVLETDGSISIVPNTSRVVRTRKHVRQLKRR
jgi:uncharacterized membrane protein YcaP (DUF421 family)